MEEAWGAAQLAWLSIKTLGVLLLTGLVPALVVTSMLAPPPDDGNPPPSMTDPL